MDRLIVAMLAAAFAAGCLQQPFDDPGLARLEIQTAYSEARTPGRDRDYGLVEGAPAAFGGVSVTTSFEPWEDRGLCGPYRPGTPWHNLTDGQRLAADACHYEGKLGGEGSIVVQVPSEQGLRLHVVVFGDTPDQPSGCRRKFMSDGNRNSGDDAFYVDLDGDATIVIPFHTFCFRAED